MPRSRGLNGEPGSGSEMFDDQDYWDVIQSGLEPETVGEGPGWVVAKLMDGMYEVVCEPSIKVQLEVSVFLKKKLRINFKKVMATDDFRLPDGRIAVCYVKRA